jgi:hypothetical protein
MAENQRVGTRAVQQAERHTGVPGVNEGALPLHQHDVVILRALQRDLLGSAGDEVGHDGIDRDAPPFDEDARLSRRDEARLVPALHERVAQLQLRRHLAHVAVGADREDHQRVDFGRATVGDRQIRRRLAGIENAHASRAGERAELRVVTDEGVETAPDLELALDRRPQPSLPLVRQATAGRCDADHDRGRPFALRDAALEIADDGNLAAKSQNVLYGLSCLLAIEHGDDALREVANAGVRGLGGQRSKIAVSDDDETMLGCRHFAVWTVRRRSTPVHGSLGTSTAGFRRLGSP